MAADKFSEIAEISALGTVFGGRKASLMNDLREILGTMWCAEFHPSAPWRVREGTESERATCTFSTSIE
jgi:hypothetical protein